MKDMIERKIRMTRGLKVPLGGEPVQEIRGEKRPRTVALLGDDYIGMRPRFEVSVGDRVKLGQVLFTDRAMPLVRYTAPAAGTVTEINRGERRALLSVVIRLEGDEEISFSSYAEKRIPALDRETVSALLLESGMWPVLRTRPFERTPDPASSPHSLFITAMDTNPLAPSIRKVLEGRERDFMNGLAVLSRLTEGKLFLCKAPGETVPLPEMKSLSVIEFSGPHPAGNAGTHIHFLDPVNRKKTVWHVQAQDAADIGALFTSGRIPVQRVLSLAGPSVTNPRLIRTRIGASLEDVVSGELREGTHRIISGSVLSGRAAGEGTGFLGRHHQQISVIPEEGADEPLGRSSSGAERSLTKAMYPIGSYEKVMPLDLMPTFLLRALEMGDLDEAESLGCLELADEDLAVCSFVCPSKIDHGANLMRILAQIRKEG